MTMPPDPMWFRGSADVLAFLEHRVFAVRGRLIGESIAANRHPAMALYERNTAHEERAIAIQVLTMESGRIRRVDGFVGKSVFPAFGLPVTRRY
jgi:RNA polymerase sigma-70 factor (ECF subfamily)